VQPPSWHGPEGASGPLELTSREREILEHMAQGLTNAGIAKRLFLTDRTVETHVRNVLMKLDLAAHEDDHRRVLAVLAYLRAAETSSSATALDIRPFPRG
jgi:DNA-binding NarL/FixJ family response regulator